MKTFLQKLTWVFCAGLVWAVIVYVLFRPGQSPAAAAVPGGTHDYLTQILADSKAAEHKGRYVVFNGSFESGDDHHPTPVLIKLDTSTGAAWRYMQVSVAATNPTYGPRQVMVGGWYPLSDDLAGTIRKASAAITDGQSLAKANP